LEGKVKRAPTEARFRDVNERIAESAQRFDASLDEYEDVRGDGATFIVRLNPRTETA
jgi:hypothetical protein